MSKEDAEISSGKKLIIWFLAVIMVAALIGWIFSRANRTVDTAIIRYEEFHELYNTCEKLSTDLCNMRELPADDKMFEQFSKAQRINTIKTQLNRWIEDYNAKSKMWNREMWKSNTLPYQLSTKDYTCYEN